MRFSYYKFKARLGRGILPAMAAFLILLMPALPLLASQQAPVQASAIFKVSGNAPGNATGFFPYDDDTPGIQTAIDAAIAWLEDPANAGLGSASVVFEAGGVYHLDTRNPSFPAFALDVRQLDTNTDRLHLVGNGATLVHRQLSGISLGINGSNNVLVSNLTIDRDPLPYMDGTVQAVSGNMVTILKIRGLDPTFFPPPGGASTFHWGWLLDPTVPGRPKLGSASFYRNTSVTQQTGNPALFDFNMIPANGVPISQDFQVGDRFTYHYRGGSNIHIRNSSDIEINNVTSYASTSMFINPRLVDGLKIINCKVEIPSGHWRSINGDGLHVKECNDVEIEGCSFSGLSDDGMNLSEVTNFSVKNCLFENKRRHAILLDSDDTGGNPPNSSNGEIIGNTANHNGGSFIAHKGGDYGTVTILQNTSSKNNLARTFGANYYSHLIPRNANFSLAADKGTNIRWASGDNVAVFSNQSGTDRSWNVQGIPGANGRIILVHRASRDQNSWLYLASATPTPVANDNVVLRPASGQNNPPENIWIKEEIPNSTFVRLRHEASNLYLTIDQSGGSTSWGDNVSLKPAIIGSPNLNQLWNIEFIED